MCGIVGAIAQRDTAPILLEGLRRLEYRGYDSAGIAIINTSGTLEHIRRLGKVQQLTQALEETPLPGRIGIAHTRWATHGAPAEYNAHPQVSHQRIAVVHNGVIENYEVLRHQLQQAGYVFTSDTDTEVIAHLIHHAQQCGHPSLLAAVQHTITQLTGAYAIAVLDQTQPDRLVIACSASPLVIGLGIEEHYIASDPLALLQVTSEFMYLQDGDCAEITRETVTVYDRNKQPIKRPITLSDVEYDKSHKGHYRHFMLKEIHEQSQAVTHTLEGRITDSAIVVESFGTEAQTHFADVKALRIVACGTSYFAGLVGCYWLEQIAGITCQVDIASEYRYRQAFVSDNSMFVSISQSGETADTLAALQHAKHQNYLSTLSICNVADSALARSSDMCFLTRAGVEIGVASTKAFTTQLVSLLLLAASIAKAKGRLHQEAELVQALRQLPTILTQTLQLAPAIETLAEAFSERQHSLFLGRGTLYPVAMEGALKLKEISYIHAEAYAAGELKHGPLALIDSDMPVVVVAPNNELLSKLKANMENVRARGGQLYVFADKAANFSDDAQMTVITVPDVPELLAPIVYTLPLQLLAYYVAIIKGTDIDQPRNLAKSVTVE